MSPVELTGWLARRLEAAGLDPQVLIEDFVEWRRAPQDSYFFGRDSTSDGCPLLFHAHMVPLNSEADLERWNTDYERRRTPRSNRYLFYAPDGRGRYLLIDIIDDPHAHDVWDARYRRYVDELKRVADQFYHFGRVTDLQDTPRPG